MIIHDCPKLLQPVFDLIRSFLTKPQMANLQAMILALLLTNARGKLKAMANGTSLAGHRTSLGFFLAHSDWDHVGILEYLALQTLRSMHPKKGEVLHLIIDDTRTNKRGRKFEALSKIWDHSQQKFVYGHFLITAAILFRGVVLPWRIEIWTPKEYAGNSFRKATQIAADLIRQFQPPEGLKVRVLFDAFYLCGPVVNACQSRGFSWCSVAARNRTFCPFGRGRRRKLGQIGPGRLRHQKRRVRMPRDRRWQELWVSAMDGYLAKIGNVRVVFSKRPSDNNRKIVAIVTNEMSLDERTIVSIYEKRWNIEVLFKELRGSLGLDAYQVQTLLAITRHLHVVCLAHLVLTHHSLRAAGAQARKAHTTVPLAPWTQRRETLRQLVRIEQINRFVNRIKHRRIRKRVREYLLNS